MKRLIEWARQQRLQGNLRQIFRIYTWWKQSERKMRLYAIKVIYPSGIALHPSWENGHFGLGIALHIRYRLLESRESWDEKELADLGNRAIDSFRKVLELNPERVETYEHFFSLLYSIGRIEEASIVLQQFEDLKRKLTEKSEEDRLGIRFGRGTIAGSIGLLGNLDYYIKAGLLGWRPPHKIIMLVSDDIPISNRCFLDYWCQYITVISDPNTIKMLSPMVKCLEDPINWALTLNGQAMFVSAANTMVQKQWDDEKRPPLMTNLFTRDYDRGWQCLEELGIPRDAWFVCLHVREPGFKDIGLKTDSYRNADIETYLPAIRTVVAHGGWVIRLGNPTMKSLPELDHVIDYAHSDVRSDWMDVFLGSQARFIIGTASGPNPISIAFGVPMVLTNYLPWNLLHFSKTDLFLPRLFWSVKEGRHLTFTEILSSKLGTGINQSSYDRLGVDILDNTPEEINDIVLEMLMRLDGDLIYSTSDERLQERFQLLTAACGIHLGRKDLTINPRIGKEFLSKYDTLLDDEVGAKSDQLVNSN